MSNLKKIEGGVTTPQGFTAGAVYTAIKKRENKKPDVAVLYSDLPCSCAACFTTNKFCAAPVILDREILKKGKARAVVINSGNLVDLAFADRPEIEALLLLSLPGMEGGTAIAGVLSGRVNPSGKLTDTIAYEYRDYPASAMFGKRGGLMQTYTEDIYIGYRYFETFAPERVRYPFGFGLSYTSFETECVSFSVEDGIVRAVLDVTNVGAHKGKEVVMLYSTSPRERIGAPAVELRAFAKTGLLAPGETERN